MVRRTRWTALSATVRGATHEHLGRGNQDAVMLKNPTGVDDVLLLAIADGHGSTRSFRSDRGSALGTQCALRELTRFIHRLGPVASLSCVRNQAKARLTRTIVTAWKNAVRDDVLANPFTLFEFAPFPEPPPIAKPGQDLPTNAYVAYGATLLAVAITRRYILYLQLGDGDILAVQDDGSVARPLPRQHDFRANETFSLCSLRAPDAFQIRVDPIRGTLPALIMLSTDGYANCFGDDEGFFRVGADLLAYLCSEGTDFVREKLEGWLRQSSQDGSGDDITVGLAVRSTALPSRARSGL